MAKKMGDLDYSNIFEAVEFPDAYKVSYLANAIVFPTYEDVRKDFGLVRAEYHLLLCLAHYSELTAQDVARITRRPRNSISRAVHRMLDLGFLKRVPDPSDARQAKLRITKEGKIMHKKISKYLVSLYLNNQFVRAGRIVIDTNKLIRTATDIATAIS